MIGSLSTERLDRTSAVYPEAVRALRNPSDLFASGNTKLLSCKSIGICGSRHASPPALNAAYEFGRAAAEVGFAVVSGYAKGVDRAAHRGALEAGGSTIAVLAEGISYFRVVRELADCIDDERLLVISPFEREARWTAYRAMHRNRYIVALSSGVVVVEARGSGGTLDAGKECLRQNRRLWVISYSSMSSERAGNAELIAKGGIPLRTPADLKRAVAEQMVHPLRPQGLLPFSSNED